MSEWKTVKLCEITECLDSKRVPITKNQREEGEVPYYGANGLQGHVKGFIFDEELLLVAEDGGSWGAREKCTYIINGKSWVNNHAHVLRMKLPYLIKYLEHYLNFSDLNKYISGTTRGKLNQKSMNEIEIYLPPEDVRKQIVSILEKAENLKQKREETNKETQKIIQSLFYEMFGDPVKNEKGWDVKTLLEVSSEKPKYGSGASAISFDGETRYIRITDVNEDGNLKNSTISSPSKFEEDYLLEEGDLLFARSGATVGKTYLHHNNSEKAIYAGYMIRFRFLKDRCNPLFVYYITKTNYYLNWIKSKQTQVAQPNINAKQYGDFKIPVPPMNLQEKFVQYVDLILSIQSKQQSSTEDINTLFDALMQKAFKGELVE
ncbi:MAG: restriction endonuclease subunit S [Nanoarchaeota archaeon]|nr:restriction endonuclease subunit S [Nanoarchaeota archaeon]